MEDTEESTEMSDTDIKLMDARLIMYLVKSYQSVTMVEGQGFIRLVRAMNANYAMPTRKAIKKRILPEMFSKSLQEQTSIVQQEAETICITVDRCTSVNEEDTFIDCASITAHFITPDYTFKSVLLNYCDCEGNSKDLKSLLKETCTEWEISGKINWCVTDGGADIVQAVNSLGWNHMGCMASKLNLALQNSLKLCDETVSKVKMIVHYFDSNFEAEQMLNEYQTKQGIAEPMELLHSEDTSWATKYDMIERFLTLQEAIEAIIAEQGNDIDLPVTKEDWIKLKELFKLLKPFKEATEELGGEKYTYASIVIAVVNGLKDVLQQLRQQPDYYCNVKEIVECIENELNEQFDGIEREPSLALCTILDPRYKLSMFLDVSAADKAKLNLVAEVRELMNGTEDRPVMANNEGGGDFCLWRRRNMILEKRQSNQSVNANAQQEVESYMQEDLADSDPCKWWQTKESKFPHLAELFKTKCNKVATAIPSEQIFTEQGIDLSYRREILSLKQAKMMVFLHANLNEDDYLRLMPEIDDDLRTLPV